MKKIITIFMTVLFALTVAEITQGYILTLLYKWNFYTVTNIEMATFTKLSISAFVVAIMLWSLRGIQNYIKTKKSKSLVNLA